MSTARSFHPIQLVDGSVLEFKLVASTKPEDEPTIKLIKSGSELFVDLYLREGAFILRRVRSASMTCSRTTNRNNITVAFNLSAGTIIITFSDVRLFAPYPTLCIEMTQADAKGLIAHLQQVLDEAGIDEFDPNDMY